MRPAHGADAAQSYLIGLWFSLRTHASQIWQNPQQLMKVDEIPAGAMHPAVRTAVQQRLTPQAVMQHILPVHGKPGATPSTQTGQPQTPTLAPSSQAQSPQAARLQLPSEGARTHDRGLSTASQQTQGTASTGVGAGAGGGLQLPAGYSPLVDTVDRDVKSHVSPMRLPSSLTPEDFTRAVAVATVTALRHQGSFIGGHHPAGHKSRPVSGVETGAGDEDEGHGGHEAPSWNRTVSSGVLLGCTLLYAIIAGKHSRGRDSWLSGVAERLTDCRTRRDPRRCRGRRDAGIRDRRKVPRPDALRTRAQYHGIHERHVVRHDRQHRAEVSNNTVCAA